MHPPIPTYLRLWLASLSHWHFVPHLGNTFGRFGVPRQARRAGVVPGMLAVQAQHAMRRAGWPC